MASSSELTASSARNHAWFSGAKEDDHRFRPAPPKRLIGLVQHYRRHAAVETVVDLGSGTGISAQFWRETAGNVIAIEPNAAMREKAVSASPYPSPASRRLPAGRLPTGFLRPTSLESIPKETAW